MRDIYPEVDKWLAGREPVALATVIHTWGSSPRGVGAKMGLTPDGKITGSVSGGCVEGAVYQTGVEVLETRQPRLLQFGVADETAWEVGLACGGSIEVFVQPLDSSFFEALGDCLQKENPVALATVVGGPDHLLGRSLVYSDGKVAFSSLGEGLERRAVQLALQAISGERCLRAKVEDRYLVGEVLSQQDRGAAQVDRQPKSREGEAIELFVEVILPPPTLVIVGGVHIAIALTAIAKALGYRTVVIDPRRSFGNLSRFPHVDQLIQAWPQEAFAQIPLTGSTAVAMLTHDPKIDDPALQIALNSPAFYVGALGSRTTQAKRRKRLLDAGLAEAQIERLHAPIGLDIGGETPEEIALSVMGEIVAVRKRRVESF